MKLFVYKTLQFVVTQKNRNKTDIPVIFARFSFFFGCVNTDVGFGITKTSVFGVGYLPTQLYYTSTVQH